MNRLKAPTETQRIDTRHTRLTSEIQCLKRTQKDMGRSIYAIAFTILLLELLHIVATLLGN